MGPVHKQNPINYNGLQLEFNFKSAQISLVEFVYKLIIFYCDFACKVNPGEGILKTPNISSISPSAK